MCEIICEKAKSGQCYAYNEWGCEHGHPHRIINWHEKGWNNLEGPDCTHPGDCEGNGIVRCVPIVGEDIFDFEIEDNDFLI